MNNNLSVVKDVFKELPNNIEAEQAVLGSILVSNEIFDEINIIISNNNFFDPMHQKIFSAIENLIYKGMLANPITLKNYFENEKDELNVPEYLVKINPSLIQPIKEIKSLGNFKVNINLHSEIETQIVIKVSPQEDIK